MEVHQLRKAFGRVIKRKALFQAALDTGFQLGFSGAIATIAFAIK